MSLEPNPKQLPGSPHEPATPKAHFALSGNRLILGCAAAVLVLSTFAIGAGIGFGFGRLSASDEGGAPGGATASSNNQLPERDLRADLEEEFGTFWEAMDVLYENFYGALPDGDSATYDAIRGVVTNLDDPNTSFLSPDEADVFRTNITGSFEGIGARVDWNVEFDTVIVVEPFENQPAWIAGVRRNDLILAVNGESVVGTDLNSAVQKIRGPKGSRALLTILRPGEHGSEPFEIEVERATIETPTVSTERFAGETLGDGALAYIRLYTFNENSGALVKQAVEEAVAAGAQGFILDLRGNSGGLLREAVKVSSLFLSDQVILYERFRDGKEETYRTDEKGTKTTLPMVVLVNEGSASASEIVAGAIQDTERAPLIGATTFGKGSVQIPETLSDGSIMRVTIARWYTPDNRTIDGTGLEPDILVELTDAQREAGVDPQLERARRELEALITGVPYAAPTQTAPAPTPIATAAPGDTGAEVPPSPLLATPALAPTATPPAAPTP